MGSRVPRLILALALAVSLFAGILTAGHANQHPPASYAYLPWVPNGVVIDDPRGFGSSGPYYGTIRVQNPLNEEIRVYVTPTANGQIADPDSLFWVTLDPFESRHVFPVQLQIPQGSGGGALLWGETVATEDPAPIAAVLKQAAPNHLEPSMRTNSEHEIVSGYTALTRDDVADEIVLPIVQTNNNWQTIIRATNFDPGFQSMIEVTLNPAGGGAVLGPFSQLTQTGDTATFNLLDLGVPDGWVGSAVITADFDVGAVAERVKNETDMLIVNPSRNSFSGQLQLTLFQHAPLVFRDWFDWNTGISLVNLTGVENPVTVTYYATDGEPVHSDDLTLPPHGMDFLYLPAGAGDEAFVGSAVIESAHPVQGVVDEVKYLGDPDEDAGHAMSYMIETESASSGQQLAVPLVQKGDPDTGGGDTSGIQIFNPSDSSVQFSMTIFNSLGDPVLSLSEGPMTLEARHSRTFYAFDNEAIGLVPGFNGSAIISVTGGSGSLVAVSNNVNYEVQHDGSVAFNLIRFQTPAGDPPELENGFITP